MNEALRHRGPDDGRIWAEAEKEVVLGQRRLAIIDLSGRRTADAFGRWSLRHHFQRRIYNYRAIREELPLPVASCAVIQIRRFCLSPAHFGVSKTPSSAPLD